jgi:tRNA G18 (ribose-2'-O)-methylase SpoU
MNRQEIKNRQRRHKLMLARYRKDLRRNQLAEPGPHEFIIVLDQLKAGYNVPKIFRSCEIFGAHEIHLINIEPFDPAPAKGALRKVPARFFGQFNESYEDLKQRGYELFCLQGNCEFQLHRTALPQRSAFIMGNEGLGITFDLANYPDIRCLSIAQFGSTESLNVSVAASIVMYEYVRQHGAADTS